MRESESNKRNYIIIGLCSILMIMVVGFAAFSQQLTINSTSEVTSTWDIEITDIQGANPSGGDAYDITPPTYTPTTATFSTGLVSPRDWDNNTGSYRVYQVEVSNLGTLTGQVSVASLDCGDNEAISCYAYNNDGKVIDENGDWSEESENYIDINEGNNDFSDIKFTLEPNEKHYIIIEVCYSEDVETQPDDLSANISLTLNYVQAESNNSGGNITPEPEITGRIVYAYNTDSVCINDSCISSNYSQTRTISDGVSDYTELESYQNGKKWFFKYELDDDDVIQNAWACMKYDFLDDPVCLKGGDESYYGTSSTGNLRIIEGLPSEYGYRTSGCSPASNTKYCDSNGLCVCADSYGMAQASNSDSSCEVKYLGYAYCWN
ncbi:MAG: hypothetical protein IKJ43_04975 [Bacilli bacterium]|nr:hypothetical protein [Bacilli bacterium]